jgi:Ni,Fe-hydrogenase III component G
MNTQTALQAANELLAPWAKETTTPEPDRLDVIILPVDVPPAVAALHDARWGYLATITGLDLFPANEIHLLYHFCSGAAIVTLRVGVPRADPLVPSICNIIPSASLFEREIGELFGVRVVGTPDTAPLLLPDDWLEGIYPLRKDFVAEQTRAPSEPGSPANGGDTKV